MLTVKRAAGKAGRVCIASGMIFGLSVSAAAAIPSGATVLYNAGGFEDTSRFTLNNNIDGQDGGKWIEAAGTGNPLLVSGGTVINTGPNSSVTGNVLGANLGSGEAANWLVPDLDAPLPGKPVVVIEWEQYVESTGLTVENPVTGPFGPLFGVEAFNFPTRLAQVVIDATTGEIYATQADLPGFEGFLDVDTPLNPGSTPDARDAWHSFRMELDFSAAGNQLEGSEGQVKVYFNSTLIFTDDFAESQVPGSNALDSSAFTDAPFAAFQDPASPTLSANAFFDDYVVYAIPEPTSLAALGLTGLVLLARRGRRAA